MCCLLVSVVDLSLTFWHGLQGKSRDGRGVHYMSAGRQQRQEAERGRVRESNDDLFTCHGYPQRSQVTTN